MPRPGRILHENAFYHVYNRGVDKQEIFKDDEDRRVFMRFMDEAIQRKYAAVYAYCLMNNHFHVYLQTYRANLNELMQRLQGRYAQFFNLRHGRVGGLFQDRYKNGYVGDDRYSLGLVRYIHLNPVRNGQTNHASDYRWSSYREYCGDSVAYAWLDTKWILDQFDRDEGRARTIFREFHSNEDDIKADGPFKTMRVIPALLS